MGLCAVEVEDRDEEERVRGRAMASGGRSGTDRFRVVLFVS